ncbi:MAG TPA: hypothetical protein VGR20_04000, partial [Acidimicrobiia bacterium]|nr:hypothetical protein [Acidimicrobiia bacterium]
WPAADLGVAELELDPLPAADPDADPATGEFALAADDEPAPGEAEPDPPALPLTAPAPGTAADEAAPESVGAAAPASPEAYPPPGAAALASPARFWLWTLRAAR